MKPKFNPFLAASILSVIALSPSAFAGDVVKANNTNALNLTTSWVGGVAPTATDVAVWDSTVTGVNSSTLGADTSWQGIRIASPGGLVTATYAAGQTLTLGTAGVDLSAATQNLTLMSPAVANTAGTLAIGGNQIWNVASGRTLVLFANSNSANQRLSGSGNIEITGGGIVRVLTGDAGSTTFAAGNGNDTYTGNWTITNGSVRGLRQGTHAWGQGTIFMNGGTIGQEQGSWTWTNNITLNTATTSTFDDFNTSGTTRTLKLQGVISGSGNLNINDTSNRMDANNGFILTGTNTLSGTVTIAASGNLRVGGVGGNDTTLGAGTTGTLGTASVTNNGSLTLSRSNSWTFGNNVSGSGVLNIGSNISGAGTQVVTVSGTNTYTGITTVGSGRMDLTGSLTSATSVSSGASITGSGSTTGTITIAGGDAIKLAGGATTTSVTGNGVTFSAATTASFLTAPVASTTYNVITYGAGGVTNPGNLTANAHGTINNNVGAQKIEFLADGAQTRTWDGVTGSWVNGGATDLWQEGDQDFYNLDNVVFSNPSAAATVTIPSAVTVGSISITNTTNAYTFDGAGTIGGTGGLNKTGVGAVTLSNVGHSFTGNVLISGGTVNTGTTQGGGTNGYLGAVSGSRTITIENTGTVVNLLANNQFGGGGKTAATIPTVVINGATLSSTRFNIIGNVNLSNSATLSQSSTDSGLYDGYEFIGGTVTVSGTGASTISTGNASANHLAGGLTTTFNVANTTGDAAADLVASAGFRDGSGDYTGVGALTKSGTGTLLLSGANSYTGLTTVSDGTLEVSGNLGASALSIASGGIFKTSGAGTLAGGTYAASIANDGALAFASTAAQTISGAISGTGTLAKSASGTLTLAGGNTYSGATSVTGGTLNISGAGQLDAASTVTVGGTGTLMGQGIIFGDVTVTTGGSISGGYGSSGALGVGSLTFTPTSTVNVATLDATADLEVTNNLAATGGAGTVTVNLPTAPVVAGTYPLITSANTLANTSAFVLGTVPALGGRQTGNLVNNTGSLDYVVSGINPSWTGSLSSEWSTSILGSPKNWVTTGPTDYIDGDSVTFDDTAPGITAVTLNTTVNPASVKFDHTTLPTYSVTGSGSIAGSGSLTKSGTGTLTLGTDNAYSGGTTVNDGTLAITHASALGTGTATLNNPGILDLGAFAIANPISANGGTLAGSTFELNGVVSGTTLNIDATGTVKLNSVNTYTGATTIVNGGLEIAGSGQLNSGNYSGAIANPTSLELSTSANQTLGGVISGTGNLVKSGTGTLTLAAANTFTGNVAINGGLVKLTAGSGLGAAQGGRPVTQVVVASGGALDYNGIAALYGVTISGTGVGGTGAIVNTGVGVGNGLAQLGNLKLDAAASVGGTGNWALLTNAWAATTLNLQGFTLTKIGTNTVALVSTTTTAGAVQVSQGTLDLGVTNGGSGVTGSASAFTLDNTSGVALSVVKDSSVGSLAGGGASGGNVAISSTRTLTVGALSTPTTFSGVISGAGALAKTGTSSLTLTGANTYGGTTAVNGGTLTLGASNTLPDASAVSIGAATLAAGAGFSDAAGTLDPTGAATIQIGAGATLAFANSNAIDWTGGTLNLTGTFVSGSSLRFGTTNGGLTATQLSQITATGFTAFALDANGFLTATPAGGYSAWKTANGTAGTIDQDHDNDGVSNGVEYFLGGNTNTTGFTALPGVTNTGGPLSVTWTKHASYTGTYGTDFVVETSTTLAGAWSTETLGGTVTITGNNVIYTFPGGGPAKKFARLKVTGP